MKGLRSTLLILAALVPLAVATAHAQDGQQGVGGDQYVVPPPQPQPQPQPQVLTSSAGQQQNGFVGEGHIYGQVIPISLGIGGALSLGMVQSGIFAGYKIGRIIFGLGWDVASADPGGFTLMQWVPGIRAALVQSDDQKVELFGQFDLGLGHNFGTPASNFRLFFNLGPGVRYWIHPQFALSGAGGFTAAWDFQFDAGQHSTVTGIFAGLQLLGVF